MGFLKKITKPISKVLDKIIPNEVKPFLPYAAAAAPFLLGPTSGIMGRGLLQRALVSGGLNLGAQLAQEGSEGDFNPLSVLLAGGTGALTSSDAISKLQGFKVGEPVGILDKTRNYGLEALTKGAKGLQGFSETLQDPFAEGKTLMDFAKAATLPTTQGTMDIGYASANRDMKAYEKAMAEFNRLQEEGSINNYNDYYTNILKYMDLAGFSAEEAEAAAERVLSGINFANGGRVGYLGGGNVATPPGMEMDLRVGGFIPIGQAERADDVLARVSKNEFVMTADAVRGMGNGDPRAGAQKMYQLMNNLEARV